MTQERNKSKSIEEENKDFRLELPIYINGIRAGDVIVSAGSFQKEHVWIQIIQEPNIDFHLEISKENFLKFHENICIAFLHSMDTKNRQELNDIVDNLRL